MSQLCLQILRDSKSCAILELTLICLARDQHAKIVYMHTLYTALQRRKQRSAVCNVQKGQYGEAFELTSNNRVDLNVIVDYAWPKFLTHAQDFVREVQVSDPLTPTPPVPQPLTICPLLSAP